MGKRVFVISDRFGSGDDELGALLMRNFLYSLARDDDPPISIAFANGGVRLACEGSESLDDLRLLADKGVPVRSCGTCLDYLGLTESLAVGEVGKMPQTVSAMMSVDGAVVIG
jgi:selenium metabolism protein YedF